jgi:hypothetical protein
MLRPSRFVFIGKLCSHIQFFCQHLQVEDYELTYADFSFEAILNQTMYALGFDWKYVDEWPILTTEGFQEKLDMTKRGSSNPPTSRPPLSVVSGPCSHTFEEGRVHYLMRCSTSMIFVDTKSVTYTSSTT